MFEVVPVTVASFLREMLPERTALLKRIEEECAREYIPIIEPEVASFLQVLAGIKNARRILEIGTGIGYSALRLALSPGTGDRHITTIEIDRDRYERACANFRAGEIENLVTPLWGDAAQILPTLQGTYDFVFMDAAKGQYPDFFTKIWPMLEVGGVLVVDNIFLNGWVIEMSWPERRKKTMVCRVRELLDTLTGHPDLLTSLVPIGDGVAVCMRRMVR